MKKRILVVEDNPTVNEYVVDLLTQLPDVEVEAAFGRDDALDRIRRRTFHLVTADIMLSDFSSSTEDVKGTEVIQRISELGEGTKVIILSGYGKVDAAQQSINKWPGLVMGYFKKTDITSGVLLVDTARKILADAVLKLYGRFDHMNAYLCRPDDRTYWETKLAGDLGVSFAELERGLNAAFAPILPVLRRANANVSLQADPHARNANGIFWSKAIGHPVCVALAGRNAEIALPSHVHLGSVVQESHKGQMKAAVWTIEGYGRDAFHESLFDQN